PRPVNRSPEDRSRPVGRRESPRRSTPPSSLAGVQIIRKGSSQPPSQLLPVLPEWDDFARDPEREDTPPGGAFADPVSCTRALPPGATVSWPVTITCSPSATPFVTTTSSPCRWPSVTWRNSAVWSDLTT